MPLSKEEKEKLVVEALTQGKSTRWIAETYHISFSDIGKIRREYEYGGQNDNDKGNNKEQERQPEQEEMPSYTKAYQLFHQGKNIVEVAIELKLTDEHAREMWIQYWKMMQLNELHSIYMEIRHNIGYFLKLYRIAKKQGVTSDKIDSFLQIVDKIPDLEKRFEWLLSELEDLEFRKFRAREELEDIRNQIAKSRKELHEIKNACKDMTQEYNRLHEEKENISNLITQTKNNNVEYAEIKKTVEEEVGKIFKDRRIVVGSAVLSIFETLRKDPDKYLVLSRMSTVRETPYQNNYYLNGYMSSPSAMSEQQSSQYIEYYKDMIVDEAIKLYDRMIKDTVDVVIDNTAFKLSQGSSMNSSLSNRRSSCPRQESDIEINRGDIAE